MYKHGQEDIIVETSMAEISGKKNQAIMTLHELRAKVARVIFPNIHSQSTKD
jgi:hypothetical protein